MIAFLWLIAVLLFLLGLTFLVSATIAAVRMGRWGHAGITLALGVALVALLAFRAHPVVVGLAAVGATFAANTLLRRNTRNAMHALRTTKLSAAHLTLLTMSFIFLIPFAWLLSTSLKTDEEQAVFPPVWIPTQQMTTDAVKGDDGKPAKLSTYIDPKTNSKVSVVELADLPSGKVKIRPVDAATSEAMTTEVERKDLTKVRQVAPRWENYPEALEYLPKETNYGLQFLGNTLFLTVMSVIGTLFASSLVAYAFARLRFPGRDALFMVLLATMMVPGAVTMMPQFLIFRGLGWIDTLNPLWVPAFFGSAFNIFMLRQFFMSIPMELEDAAKIDGCGPFAVYLRIMLPLVKPALAAIAIMATLGAWNNFQGPLIYLSSPEKMPLAYALQLYQQQHSGEPGLLMAASTLVILPIILLFFFTQRYFIEGVSLSGLGGR
jgi:multiple sugar transport system permease protein